MTNRDQVLRWLQAIELSKLALTAAIDDQGNLGPVGGLWPKLSAAAEEAARMGLLQLVGTAENQDDVPEPLKDPNASPLRVIQGPSIEDLLERLYEEDGLRAAVRGHYRDSCACLDLPGQKDLVPLDPLYQELPLLREVQRERLPREPRSRDQAKDDESRPTLAATEILRWEEQVRDEQVRYARHTLGELFADFRRVVPKAASAIPRFVVLGPPGSGKTTLEQVLAHRAATGTLCFSGRRLLPMRLRLREWEAWAVKSSDPEASLPDYLAERHKDLSPAAPAASWRRWLLEGNILLLLDGLDEIEGRSEFLAALRSALAAFPACPAMLTCRTVSFDRHQLVCHDLPVFILAGLEDTQRDAFIRAYPWRSPDPLDAGKLIEQLNRLPAMRPLAANPLLLSILCFVVDDPQNKVDLPATRGEVYDRAIERMLALPRRVPVQYPGGKPDLPLIRKRRMLERAALTLLADQDGGRPQLTFDQGTVLETLERASVAERLDNPADMADAFLSDLTTNSGLIQGKGDLEFFFLHLTVQEFLAASALGRWLNQYGDWNTPLVFTGKEQTVRDWVDRKSWDPRWQEVICLLAGRLNDPGWLLDMLSDSTPTSTNPMGDDLFRHRLALAALCLPELPRAVRGGQTNRISLITGTLVYSWFNAHMNGTIAAYSNMDRVLPALGLVNGLVPAETHPLQRLSIQIQVRSCVLPILDAKLCALPLLDGLANLLKGNDARITIDSLAMISRMGETAATPAVLNQLSLLLSDPESDVRTAAARALGHLGAPATDASILERLVALSRDSSQHKQQSSVSRNDPLILTHDTPMGASTAALCDLYLKHSSTELMTIIFDLINSGPDFAEGQAIESIGSKGAAALIPGFLDRLTALLCHPEQRVRMAGVRVVARLKEQVANPVFFASLFKMLRDANRGVRCDVANAIGYIGTHAGTPLIVDGLTALFHDADPEVQMAAVNAVVRIGAAGGNENVLSELARLLHHPDFGIRGGAAWTVSYAGNTAATPVILESLSELLSDPSTYVLDGVRAAVRGLGVHAASPQIMRGIFRNLYDSNMFVKSHSAKMVGILGSAAAEPEILDRLAELLYDPEWYVRNATVEGISGLGKSAATPQFLDRLAKLLRDRNPDVCATAAQVVGHLGTAAATSNILEGLYSLIRVHNTEAASAISQIGAQAVTSEFLLLMADWISTADYRVSSCATYVVRSLGSLAATPEFLARLAQMMGQSKQVCLRSIFAVQSLGAHAATSRILGAATDLLVDSDYEVSLWVIRALRAMGKLAATSGIIVRLTALLHDSNRSVRYEAADSLREIQAEGERVFQNALGEIRMCSTSDLAR
jgi:HEAT repeat protein